MKIPQALHEIGEPLLLDAVGDPVDSNHIVEEVHAPHAGFVLLDHCWDRHSKVLPGDSAELPKEWKMNKYTKNICGGGGGIQVFA